MAHPVTLANIREASARIRPIALETPVLHSERIDQATGTRVLFKCENLQRGGAFKIRGAANFIYALGAEASRRGVVAYSSGNHAQAVAIAAKSVGAQATIVMPTDSPRTKMEGTRAQGAKVVTFDRFREKREEIAARIAAETGAATVPPFDHPWIIAGQGTAALELLTAHPDLDALVAPIGGGGLLSGCSIAARGLTPRIRLFGAEPVEANDTYLSLRAGHRVEIPTPATIADGLRSPAPGEITFPILASHLEDIILVTEDEIKAAMKFLLTHLRVVVEPSGAASAAAVLSGRLPAGLNSVGVILSGGNVDYELLASL